jgi:hypothetical protein
VKNGYQSKLKTMYHHPNLSILNLNRTNDDIKKDGDLIKRRIEFLELALLVVRTFEVVEVLEGDLLEDGVDGLRVEALADALRYQ